MPRRRHSQYEFRENAGVCEGGGHLLCVVVDHDEEEQKEADEEGDVTSQTTYFLGVF